RWPLPLPRAHAPRAHLLVIAAAFFHSLIRRCTTSFGISSRFRELSRSCRQVTHVILTHPPLVPRTHTPKGDCPLPALDLHVLGTPPAFVLSQDQTLQNSLK